jgi:hypothetical protein
VRAINLSEVRCEACQDLQPREDWGRPCRGCGQASFHVELERVSSGLNGENFLDAVVQNALSGYSGGEFGLLLALATDDVGGPGVYFKTHAFLRCGSVSFREISEFLLANVEARTRTYVAWKRRELELALPEGCRICNRCRVAFRVYANAWGRAGLCSKACYQAFMKSWSGNS